MSTVWLMAPTLIGRVAVATTAPEAASRSVKRTGTLLAALPSAVSADCEYYFKIRIVRSTISNYESARRDRGNDSGAGTSLIAGRRAAPIAPLLLRGVIAFKRPIAPLLSRGPLRHWF